MLLNAEQVSTAEVSLIRDANELEALAGEWAALWEQCENATPFQSPHWLIPWWRHLGHGELFSVTMRVGGVLVGFAPLFLDRGAVPGARSVVFLGTGISDILDILAAPGYEEQVVAATLRSLHGALCEECDLQELCGESPLLAAQGLLHSSAKLAVQEVRPVLSLAARAIGRVVPGQMLEKLRYYQRRLGGHRFVGATESNFRMLFGRFLELHRAQWRARGQDGVLAHPAVEQFHWAAAEQLLRSGNLRLYGLCVREAVVAALYGFHSGSRTCYYLSGFDPAFSALSPGTLIVGHAIECAVAEGATGFDFLRGRGAYKYLWGAKAQLNYRLRLRLADVDALPLIPIERGGGRCGRQQSGSSAAADA